MRAATKWLVGLTGFLTLVIGCLLVVMNANIGFVSDWVVSIMNRNATLAMTILIVAGGFIALVGLIILLIGLFKPRTVGMIEFHGSRGVVRLPVHTIEQDLKLRIEDAVDVGNLEVNIRAHAKQRRADVKVHGTALAQGTPRYDDLGETVLAVVNKYLKVDCKFNPNFWTNWSA
ncbi:alkaline shock response membrane anchor protein AmaP [Furfurilactobacillus cerevisiae]|uniref:alkaline shock response membrane anchor protein AmaP n=1 Tax=Furfurilactobacillus rossiae TaxID=231049 RepID=UPI003B98369F